MKVKDLKKFVDEAIQSGYSDLDVMVIADHGQSAESCYHASVERVETEEYSPLHEDDYDSYEEGEYEEVFLIGS